jgi:DNA ligase-1
MDKLQMKEIRRQVRATDITNLTVIEDLERLQEFVLDMKSTSSLLDKKDIIKSIKDDKFITKVLHYTYNPYFKYHVTSKNCKKNHGLADHRWTTNGTIFDMLDGLKSREFTGHNAIAHVNGFVQFNIKYAELIYNILDRNLELRASDSVINKVIPGLIPEFKVALANVYEPKIVDWNDTWYASRKLDGVRCLAIVDEEGVCKLYSRVGNEFTTLDKVKKAIESTGIINHVFDGEICLVDEHGNEDFQSVMKEIKKKDHTIEAPVFKIFDMLHIKEFNSEIDSDPLEGRLHTLRSWLNKSNHLDILMYEEQMVISGDDHFDTWVKLAADNEWEGVMLRKNVKYEGKRTKNLLKVKKFFDAEYVVESLDFDNHRVIRDGKEVLMPMLAQAYITHKGYEVAVGSGWSQAQRIRYEANPQDLIGKTITVQYFEETKNQEGGISLRFPTVKHVYENGRNV